MQSPFTPRINQPVANQGLQNVAPTGAFPRVRQAAGPEPIQSELLIENARQPTRAPLARTMQLHLIEAHLYAIRSGMVRHRPFRGKQGQLRRLLRSFIEGFDNLTPCFMLAIVDLAKIQHIALYHFAPGTPLALDDIPITMLFAVLEPSVASQIHAD